MYKKIVTPFIIVSLVLISSFSLFDAKKAEAAFSFGSATAYTVQSNPWGLAVEDLDGDTHEDLVATNSGSGTMSVLMGNGDGTFDTAVNYTVGSSPRAVTLADVDNDTFVDALVSNRNGNSISVLLGNGDGTFQTALSPAITCTNNPGCTPRYTAVGLLDGDANPDLVIAASGNVAGNSVVVQLGNGDGTFGTSVPYTSGLVNVFVALYDFDGDTNLDIITANETADTVSVLLGNGDGTFDAPTNITGIDAPEAIAIYDFDGDTNADIAVPALNIGGVKVYLGNGDGTFGTGTVYSTGSTPNQVDVSDFDHDGNTDLVISNRFGNNVSVLSGNGDGTFDTAQNYSVGALPFNVKAGDFDEDGWDDLVSADGGTNTVSVLLNTPHEKDITTFTFGLSGESDNIVGTDITVDLPEGTNVTSLTPTVVHTGVSISPDGTPQDFTNPVVYTVTALDTTTKDYTVTINFVPVSISILSPGNGGTVRMAVPLIATTDSATTCTYKVDAGSSIPFDTTGDTIHTSSVEGLTGGSHTITVTCGSASESTTFTKQAPGEVLLYAVNGSSGGLETPNLYTLNPENGQIASTIGPTGHDIVGLAMDPTTGILYGTTGASDTTGSQPYGLFTIDTDTGAATFLGTTTDPSGPTDQDLGDLAFNSSGTLYGFSLTDNATHTVDIGSCNGVTCDTPLLGDSGFGSYGAAGLVFTNSNTFYSTQLGEDYIITLNESDGSVFTYSSVLNPSGSSYAVTGLTADTKDMLFGLRTNYGSGPSDLVTIRPGGAYIVSMGGDNTDLVYMNALAFSIDLNAPTVDITLDDYDLIDGETATVTFTFNEAVLGFTNADITVENGTLSTISSSDGGVTWTGTFTPNDSIEDATNAVSVGMTGLADLALNFGVGTTSSSNYTIDTLEPSLPESSLDEGTYHNTRSLDLSSSGSTSIRYTTNGSTPSCSSGTVYSGTIEVTATMTLKAVGCDDAGNESPLASFDYVISVSSSGSSGGGLTHPKPEPITTPAPQPSSILGSGQCSSDLIITQNLRQGARDGKFESYNGTTVTQVKTLQAHINRILAAKYQQAAGPVDGIFGPLTKQGVQRLQIVLNDNLRPVPILKIDGIVGPFTKAAINNSCGL